MNDIDPDVSLGALVRGRFDLAARLDDLGLDYCCGGETSLRDACQEAGLDVGTVVERLDVAEPARDVPAWTGLDPLDLMDHIEATHHVFLRDSLPRLRAVADKVVGAHGERHPELHQVRAVLDELAIDIEPHLADEERVLFPMIRSLSSTDPMAGVEDDSEPVAPVRADIVHDAIAAATTDHDVVGTLLAQLRDLTARYTIPDDGCASYEALFRGLQELENDTHVHVHKENNIVFPAALDAVGAAPAL